MGRSKRNTHSGMERMENMAKLCGVEGAPYSAGNSGVKDTLLEASWNLLGFEMELLRDKAYIAELKSRKSVSKELISYHEDCIKKFESEAKLLGQEIPRLTQIILDLVKDTDAYNKRPGSSYFKSMIYYENAANEMYRKVENMITRYHDESLIDPSERV